MHLITLEQTLILHQGIMLQSNGTTAIRDKSILESAIAQPNITYDSVFLYPSLISNSRLRDKCSKIIKIKNS